MRWLLALLAVAYSVSLTAQPLHFGYYEVDHLYDTLPSPFYNDTDYTPEGRYRWNSGNPPGHETACRPFTKSHENAA